jgi:CheY-like chemotaxis protein
MIESLADILLVDSNPHDVELTTEALNTRHLANRVKVLHDGQEALDYILRKGKYKEAGAAQKNPVLILLALRLPKIDGPEVLCRIKSDERTKNIPIVVLTSSSDDTDRLKCHDLGVSGYIVKPVDIENFIEAVGDVGFYWAVFNEPPIR